MTLATSVEKIEAQELTRGCDHTESTFFTWLPGHHVFLTSLATTLSLFLGFSFLVVEGPSP